MADTPTAPPWPNGTVDFNAAHEAARKGKLEAFVAGLEKADVGNAVPADTASADKGNKEA